MCACVSDSLCVCLLITSILRSIYLSLGCVSVYVCVRTCTCRLAPHPLAHPSRPLFILQPSWRCTRTSLSTSRGSTSTPTSASPSRHSTASTARTQSGSPGELVTGRSGATREECFVCLLLVFFLRRSQPRLASNRRQGRKPSTLQMSEKGAEPARALKTRLQPSVVRCKK